ncbi:MAG: hypothetical protein H6Q25_424 [Bacteroidetes bacterium]|nr:hypothetical protein [Bacteroidota bacterium]
MKNKFYIALFVAFVVLLVSCDPETDDPIIPNPNSSTHVYIAANDSRFIDSGPAVYWKDSVKYVLSSDLSGSLAKAIFVDNNNNIYVGGKEFDKPVYWKNGTVNVLSDSYGCVNGLYISNNNVYAVGYLGKNAVVWKNGVIDTLNREGIYVEHDVTATAIFVQGNDVYISGFAGAYRAAGKALFWKNGLLTIISDNVAMANDIFVSGNNVYIVGIDKYQTTNMTSHKAVIWTNGISQDLNIGGLTSDAYSIFIANDTTYVACNGYFGSAYDGYFKGCLWKNGNSSVFNCLSIQDVFVLGSDVYMVGIDGDIDKYPVLFKNGVKKIITYANSYPTAIFVK